MKNIYVTVDVESYPLGNVDKFVFGNTSKGYYGIDYIIEKFKKNRIKATFFVSSLEYLKQKEMKQAIKIISDSGFDIGVHTHPGNISSKKPYMFQWDLNSQKKIIEKAKTIITKFSDIIPRVHRAGTYSANIDTLNALINNRIYIDSSLCYKRHFNGIHVSKLDNQLESNFYPSKYKKLTEIPLTRVLKKQKFLIFNREEYININANERKERLKRIFATLEESHTDNIVPILHSFDFVTKGNGKIVPNTKNLENFDYFIKTIKTKKYKTDYLKNFKLNMQNYNPKIEITETLNCNDIKNYLFNNFISYKNRP